MLDGHEYLTKRGWAGKGTALRSGGISRPITVTQKKTLSGLGKDRDEAFPFWEHVFEASINTINIKVAADSDSDSGTSDAEHTRHSVLQRTSTGILSNRRPTIGTPVSSGTPIRTDDDTKSRLSILAIAKRDAARRRLYAGFYRGPVITSLEPTIEPTPDTPLSVAPSVPSPVSEHGVPSISTIPIEIIPPSRTKRKRPRKDDEHFSETADEKAARKLGKRARKAEKRRKREIGEESLSTPLSEVFVEADYEKRPKQTLVDPIVPSRASDSSALSHPEPMAKHTKKGDGRGKPKRRNRDVKGLVGA